jgi:hypothetical protein
MHPLLLPVAVFGKDHAKGDANITRWGIKPIFSAPLEAPAL